MRIAVDTNALYITKAGPARYVTGVLSELRSDHFPDLDVSAIAWPVEGFSYRQPARAFKTAFREYIWGKWIAPQTLQHGQFQLLHSPVGILISPPKGLKHIVTLHDLAVLRHPERFRKWHRFSTIKRLGLLKSVDKIICISRFTADEAIDLLHLPIQKLEVIYNGCDLLAIRPCDEATIRALNLPADYFLFVGSLEPGKNLSLLNDAYELAASRNISLPALVIVGARWMGVETEKTPSKGWFYLGRQPDEVLVRLYQNALGLLYPTKYEGFGLPIVEAMVSKCPVICSRVASLPEVGGDAAIYCEQTPESYLNGMLRLISHPTLRDECINAGLKQAQKFSWVKCASETAEVYRHTIT